MVRSEYIEIHRVFNKLLKAPNTKIRQELGKNILVLYFHFLNKDIVRILLSEIQ